MKQTYETLNWASQAITIPVGARVFFGYSVDDWVLIGTACLLILNLLWVVSRVWEFYAPKIAGLFKWIGNVFRKKT